MFVWVEYCFFFNQKTAYGMRIRDWSSDVCSSDLVELAAQCRPLDLADRPIAALRVVEAVALDGGALHFLGDRVQLCARLLERELHVAGTLGPVHPHEGLARRAADREEAEVAHDQHFVVATVAHDAIALCEVGGDAVVLLIAAVRGYPPGELG